MLNAETDTGGSTATRTIYDLSPEPDDFEHLYNPFYSSDITSNRLPAPNWLFEPVLRTKTLTLISAEPYTGKTLLMLSMLLSIDVSLPLVGRFSPVPGHRCLFLGQDAPTWDYHTLFVKLYNGLCASRTTELQIKMPSLLIFNRGISITSPAFLALIESAVSTYGISVLFLDTLQSFHDFDENSNREMKLVMRILQRIRDRFSLTIIFSHHISKFASSNPSMVSPNMRTRGASTVAGSIDHHFLLSYDGFNREANSAAISFTIAKGRGLALSAASALSAFSISSPHPTKESLVLSAINPSFTEKLLDFLREPRPRSAVESWAAAAHPSRSGSAVRSLVSRALDELRSSNRIHQPSDGIWQTT